MTLIRAEERGVVRAVAALLDCNPFLPERVGLERQALGDAFVPVAMVWHAEGEATGLNPNTARLRDLAEHFGAALQRRLAAGAKASAAELDDYHRLVLSLLWLRYEDEWWALIEARDKRQRRVSWYPRFARDVQQFLSLLPGAPADPARLFALGFQGRRAFHHIFRKIFGGSRPAAQLRAAVWQSIFTDDVREYRDGLDDRMADPTLITGESGTGKELVARAIALSRYVPFNARTHTFAADGAAVFCAVNLSALSPTLIESELFGHCRGAFTGAVQERRGFLETCGAYGAVFLDEIGDLDAAIQLKLLRVLESREFHRVGESTRREFGGKPIAATHRDLEQEIQAGRFRADLYYRICADQIRTPALREQLADAPDDLRHLVRIAAGRIARTPEAAAGLTRKVELWMEAHLPPDYPWPGNMRELEQCVRNIRIRSAYSPPRVQTDSPRAPGPTAGGAAATDQRAAAAPDAAKSANGASSGDAGGEASDPFMARVRDATLTADELLQGYCVRVQAQTGNYEETARRLKLNWKTVRANVRAWTQRPGTDAQK